jgi:diaminobutyrate-2-oxoglutarate transaminase
MRRDAIFDHVNDLGAYALGVLEELARDHEIVGEARGRGLMLGMEMVDASTGEPNTLAAVAVRRQAIERGLIVELGGRDDCVVRLLPPLNVSRETLDQAFEILGSVLDEISPAASRNGHSPRPAAI